MRDGNEKYPVRLINLCGLVLCLTGVFLCTLILQSSDQSGFVPMLGIALAGLILWLA